MMFLAGRTEVLKDVLKSRCLVFVLAAEAIFTPEESTRTWLDLRPQYRDFKALKSSAGAEPPPDPHFLDF